MLNILSFISGAAMKYDSCENIRHFTVGVIGGGAAGSTIALRLSEMGVSTVLFEQSPSLVNGPPFCHLHAGGNLYREISEEHCVELLKQSVDTIRVFRDSVNVRPTVIATPVDDNASPVDLLPRLEVLQKTYAQLVQVDCRNKVMGDPKDYFTLFSRQDMDKLKQLENPSEPMSPSEWMIPVAKSLELDKMKYPIVMVQEYGLSVFRWSSTASLALSQMKNCKILTDTKVTHLQIDATDKSWMVTYKTNGFNPKTCSVDYIVNACGYRTGEIDDLVNRPRDRMVEFKASYIAYWDKCKGQWPEVIVHGERGTPKGMAQLTPYPNGFFQLHGMTKEVTLFEDGLVKSNEKTAQPLLSEEFQERLFNDWTYADISDRTEKAIQHVSQFVPSFQDAVVGGKPLFGAQQIPGSDSSLRVSAISTSGHNYARCEIVKASTALLAADLVVEQLASEGLIQDGVDAADTRREDMFPVTLSLDRNEIIEAAESIALERNYPVALAQPIGICHVNV